MRHLLLLATMLFTGVIYAFDSGHEYIGDGISRLVVDDYDYPDSLAHAASLKSTQHALYDAVSNSGRSVTEPWKVVMLLNLYDFELKGSDLLFEKGLLDGSDDSREIFRLVAVMQVSVRGAVIDAAILKLAEIEHLEAFQSAYSVYSKQMSLSKSTSFGEVVTAFKKLQHVSGLPAYSIGIR